MWNAVTPERFVRRVGASMEMESAAVDAIVMFLCHVSPRISIVCGIRMLFGHLKTFFQIFIYVNWPA